MKAYFFEPGAPGRMEEVNDFETFLHGEVELLHPFEEDGLCLIARLDREDLAPCIAITDEEGYSLETLSGPVLAVRDEGYLDDIQDEDIDYLLTYIKQEDADGRITYDDWKSEREWEPEEDDEGDPLPPGITLLDEDEFLEKLRREQVVSPKENVR